jgi:uncharacterized protein
MATFVIKQQVNGQYFFVLTDANGNAVIQSEAYPAKSSCTNGIQSVRNHAPDNNNYQRQMTSDGRYYFNLIARNHEPIGRSMFYDTASERDTGIESVKANAPQAGIDDQTL